jgi:hypothetical protein
MMGRPWGVWLVVVALAALAQVGVTARPTALPTSQAGQDRTRASGERTSRLPDGCAPPTTSRRRRVPICG